MGSLGLDQEVAFPICKAVSVGAEFLQEVSRLINDSSNHRSPNLWSLRDSSRPKWLKKCTDAHPVAYLRLCISFGVKFYGLGCHLYKGLKTAQAYLGCSGSWSGDICVCPPEFLVLDLLFPMSFLEPLASVALEQFCSLQREWEVALPLDSRNHWRLISSLWVLPSHMTGWVQESL